MKDDKNALNFIHTLKAQQQRNKTENSIVAKHFRFTRQQNNIKTKKKKKDLYRHTFTFIIYRYM